jgi:8-oxo-dGTP diphosphatase
MEEDYPRAIRLAKEWVEEEKLKDPDRYTIEEVYEMMQKDLKDRNRQRACAAIIRDDQILMVKMQRGTKVWWSLPGGGVEKGERFEETVARELREEVNLSVIVGRHLYSYDYSGGECRVFSAEISCSHIPELGFDPEYPQDDQMLKDVKWWPNEVMKDDFEVSRVIKLMGISAK